MNATIVSTASARASQPTTALADAAGETSIVR
jgi:hypothetical protein